MPNKTSKHQHEPDDLISDISTLATTRLIPFPPRDASSPQQIARYKAEIQHLDELAAVFEQAITALVFRLHITTDQVLYEALVHNRADLQRYQDELVSLRAEYENAIKRIQTQK